MTREPAVRVRGLRRSYGAVTALDGVDLTVWPGEVVALLGPNGAGKTTTVEIIEGLRRRDAGEVSVLGADPDDRDPAVRRRIGVGLQGVGIDPYLTVAETVALYAGYYPRPLPVEGVLDLVGLGERAEVRVSRLSDGQRRRLDLGVALCGDPELLVLDEPTAGIDPEGRRDADRIIEDLAARGRTVLLTTHDLADVERFADRVAIIVRGRVVAEGTPDDLVRAHFSGYVVRFRAPRDAVPAGATVADAVVRRVTGGFEVRTDDPKRVLRELRRWAANGTAEVTRARLAEPALEDVYLDLTHDAEAALP